MRLIPFISIRFGVVVAAVVTHGSPGRLVGKIVLQFVFLETCLRIDSTGFAIICKLDNGGSIFWSEIILLPLDVAQLWSRVLGIMPKTISRLLAVG